MKIQTFIVNRNTLELAEKQKKQVESMSSTIHGLQNEVIIHNCTEEPFLGKCHGHTAAYVRHGDPSCDYYWFNHPDLDFSGDMKCLEKMLKVMEETPKIAVLSPINPDGHYLDMYREGFRWHPVARVDYLSLLVRGSVMQEIGFLNPEFIYSWGASHEYSYQVYSRGWLVAYCDIARLKHLGGTTYGKSDTISREEYQRNARKFAREYLSKEYGRNWDKKFAAVLPADAVNTYTISKRSWRGSFIDRLLNQWSRTKGGNMDGVKLNLGSGKKPKEGWINVDLDGSVHPDVVADVSNLGMFKDEGVDAIESYHLFEHFTYPEAVKALDEWYRVLKIGGTLAIEMPNLDRCIEILFKKEGWDAERLALMGIYGDNKAIAVEGYPQAHKYGWSPTSLTAELERHGFTDIHYVPVVQNFRPATKYNRDMRLECVKGEKHEVSPVGVAVLETSPTI